MYSRLSLLHTVLVFVLLLGGCQSRQAALPPPPKGMVSVPAGNTPDGRAVASFWMDQSPVTVAEFERFVKATKYQTEAEKFGDGGVFEVQTGTWTLVKGANFRYPFGPTMPRSAANHPVTQVSWNDAVAYCQWAKKRLPTRTEWEHAARNADAAYALNYPWGDYALQKGSYKANFWQGSFPQHNTVADGFLYTSPVGHFGATPLGLTDLGGNVWQWVQEWHPDKPTERTQCGGSYLCDPAVCHGFQISRTASSTPETSLCHVGFRCVKDYPIP